MKDFRFSGFIEFVTEFWGEFNAEPVQRFSRIFIIFVKFKNLKENHENVSTITGSGVMLGTGLSCQIYGLKFSGTQAYVTFRLNFKIRIHGLRSGSVKPQPQISSTQN